MARTVIWRAARFVVMCLSSCIYGALACAYLLIELTGVILAILAIRVPNMEYRHDPLIEVRFDHALLVLDEPTILCSYRLNDLFRKFDEKILVKCQLPWYIRTLQYFHHHLETLKGPDEVYRLSEAGHTDLMRLLPFLNTVADAPEAISFMHDWMDNHPLLSDPEHTVQE
jgi:hypothetical protein